MTTITINVENWKHVPQELAMIFVLKDIREKIENGEYSTNMSGNYYDLNGIEYSVTIKS